MSILEFESGLKEIETKLKELEGKNMEEKVYFEGEMNELRRQRKKLLKEIYQDLSAWEVVQVARHPERPIFSDYVEHMADEMIELHGDRSYGDDRGLLGGLCWLGGEQVILIGNEKGRGTVGKITSNFGMSKPEGYRKALRLMKLGEKYGKAIITLIDTPGAYPGIEAEERGQSEAIARNLIEMVDLKVPTMSIVIGEGGSGGALALGLTDKILMLEYSIYSVISPEGCASILWKDSNQRVQASKSLRVTSKDLLSLEVIDEIIVEPLGGAHRNYEEVAKSVKESILKNLKSLKKLSMKKLLERRHKKFNKLGQGGIEDVKSIYQNEQGA